MVSPKDTQASGCVEPRASLEVSVVQLKHISKQKKASADTVPL